MRSFSFWLAISPPPQNKTTYFRPLSKTVRFNVLKVTPAGSSGGVMKAFTGMWGDFQLGWFRWASHVKKAFEHHIDWVDLEFFLLLHFVDLNIILTYFKYYIKFWVLERYQYGSWIGVESSFIITVYLLHNSESPKVV